MGGSHHGSKLCCSVLIKWCSTLKNGFDEAAHPAPIGVPATSPRPNWTFRDLFREIDPNLESRVTSGANSDVHSTADRSDAFGKSRRKTNHENGDQSPDWACAVSVSEPLRKTTQIPGPSMTAGMDIDEIDAPSISPSDPAMDPRDELREQLLVYLRSALPQIIESTIEHHRLQKLPLQKIESSSDSIHAKPSHTGRNSSSSSRVPPKPRAPPQLPSPKEYEIWSLSQSIKFLSEWRPVRQGALPTKAAPFTVRERGSLLSLANFVESDRRQGREFARGDWDRACEGLRLLCPDAQDPFEKAVKEAF